MTWYMLQTNCTGVLSGTAGGVCSLFMYTLGTRIIRHTALLNYQFTQCLAIHNEIDEFFPLQKFNNQNILDMPYYK